MTDRSTITTIMEQAQVFASTYALVGGRFDDGTKMAQSEEEKAILKDMILASQQVVTSAPEGWQLVPKQPTKKMLTWGRLAHMNIVGGYGGPSQWEAMLAAAPQALPEPAGLETTIFPVCTPVEKVSGYPFPGTVVATFRTLTGQERFVVEATGAEYAGMLHIFNGEQLRATTKAEGSAK